MKTAPGNLTTIGLVMYRPSGLGKRQPASWLDCGDAGARPLELDS